MKLPLFEQSRYRPITRSNIQKFPEWRIMSTEVREAIKVVSCVLPFRANTYVTRHLIDWGNIPNDPIFQLTFPQREMLKPEDYSSIRTLLQEDAPRREFVETANEIRLRLNPHPAGQLSHNVPEIDGTRLDGVQHKYRETVLFFPAQGQTCHAYCTYCFRWPQFSEMAKVKFQAKDSKGLARYLRSHHEVSDLLITGGDPMIMKARVLGKYVTPLLKGGFDHLSTIRLGTKALAYWPYRFLSESDSDDLMLLFERIVKSGRHLALMAHFSHPVELSTQAAEKAIQRIRSTGAEIRMQAPLVRRVNDRPEDWAEMWRAGVKLGMIPYYMFVERDTGPKGYFEVPLHRAHLIFREAFNQVSGLARTVRGPSMSAFPGKIHLLGTSQVGRERVFVFQFLQARDPNWVGRPFFAQFDADATWIDDLKPAFGKQHFFFEREVDPWAVSTVA